MLQEGSQVQKASPVHALLLECLSPNCAYICLVEVLLNIVCISKFWGIHVVDGCNPLILDLDCLSEDESLVVSHIKRLEY